MFHTHVSTFENFLKWVSIGHTKATVSSYRYSLHAFDKWLARNDKRMAECGLNDITEYLTSLDAFNFKDSTRSIYACAVKSLYKWLNEQGVISWNYQAIPYISPSDSTRYNALNPEEFYALVGTCNDSFPQDVRDKAVMWILWDTGIRLCELLSLELKDIEPGETRGKAVVRTYKRKKHFREVYWEKEANDAVVHWLDVRRRLLGRYSEESNAVFLNLSQGKSFCDGIKRHAVQRSIKWRREMAGITRQISTHSFRHGFTTERKEANPWDLQQWLGHAKITTTQIYVHHERKDLENSYRRSYPKHVSSRAYEQHQEEGEHKKYTPAEKGLLSHGTQGRDADKGTIRPHSLSESRREYEQEGRSRSRAWEREKDTCGEVEVTQ